jgi:hypothetical protein
MPELALMRRDSVISLVVPAKAGTTRRSRAFFTRWLTAFRSNNQLWLWVPAFAGTTDGLALLDSNFKQQRTRMG